MRIGTMFLGKVEALGEESIQTKFFILGVPLVPVSSHYVVAEQVNGIRGFEIPLHAKSVLFGYLRIYAWLAALLTGVFAYIERHDAGGLWVMCALSAAVAIGTTFALGKLNKDEQLKRLLLRTLTGVGAPPALLPVGTRLETSKKLQAAWEADEGNRAWRKAIEKGESRPLLYVLAEYHEESDLARRAFEHLKAGDNASIGGPYR